MCSKSTLEPSGELTVPSHPRANAAGTETRPGVWNGYQLKLASGHNANSLPETMGEKTVRTVQRSSPP